MLFLRLLNFFNSLKYEIRKIITFVSFIILFGLTNVIAQGINKDIVRQRISINEDWKFYKYDSIEKADDLIYDVRPEVYEHQDDKPADTKPTEAEDLDARQMVLKQWILPTGNDFIKDQAKRFVRPEGNPGSDFPFVQNDFDDNSWENVNLPHDWAIKGPFYEGP